MEPSKKMRLDDILHHHLGEIGFYQKFHYLLVCIPSLFAGMHALVWTFSAASLNFRCLYPGENKSDSYSLRNNAWLQQASYLNNYNNCSRLNNFVYNAPLPSNRSSSLQMESCLDGYAWDHSDVKLSIVEQFELVCDSELLIAVIQAVYFVGQMLGSIIFGILSDKIGRKPVFLIAIFVQLVCDSLISISPNWWLTMMLRFGVGFGHPGVFIMSCVIGAELVGPRYRNWSSVVAGILWAIGEMILGGLSYPLRDYRYLQLAISLPAVFLISYWWLLPESARWLMAQGRHKDVHRILRRVATWNNRPPLPDDWHEKVDKEIPHELSYSKSFAVLFATPRLRFRTLISFTLWAVVTMGYYGLAFKPDLMGGDNRLAFILSGLFEIPFCFAILPINVTGRKLMASFGFLLAAFCLGLTLAIPENMAVASLLLVVIGKGALTGVFALVYIWTPEHYPTIIRNTATGACSMAGRVGGIAASFFSFYLANNHKIAVILTFAGLAAVAGILALLLPETTGEPLLETIQEAEELGIDQPLIITGRENRKRVKQRMLLKNSANVSYSSIQNSEMEEKTL